MKIMLTAIALLLTGAAQADWDVLSKADEFDGTRLAQASASPTSEKGFWKAHCEQDDTGKAVTVLIITNFSEYFEDGFHTVLYRVDDNEPGKLKFVKTPNGLIASDLTNSTGTVASFIAALKAGTKLVVRATPYNESATTRSYSLAGFTKAYDEMYSFCAG